MSHANAALTPRQRLRLARQIVDDGWSVSAAADYFRVSYPTAAKWARRYFELGPDGMSDRSSRPHAHPNKTPQRLVKKIVHLRIKKRLGPVQIAGRLGMQASTVHAVLVRCHLNRLSHVDVKTGEPARRYEHETPGALIHVDVKKLGNISDGGGWRFVGRSQGYKNRSVTAMRTGRRGTSGDLITGHAFVHTVIDDHSRVAYADGSTTTSELRPQSGCCAEQCPGSEIAASPSSESSPTTDRPTAHMPGGTPAPTSASHPSSPARAAPNQREDRTLPSHPR